MVMARLGWRTAFIAFGVASLLWLVPWWTATKDASSRARSQSAGDAPSFFAVLRRREALGASLGHLCFSYGFYFVISWLPLYLVKSRGLTMSRMATLGGLIYVLYAVCCLVTGIVSDRAIRAGASITRVRKTALIAASVIVSVSLATAAIGSTPVAIACLFCAAAGFGLGSPNLYAVAQTLAGPRAAGKWMGVQSCIGNLAGVIAPIVTGTIVDRTGQFFGAFLVAGAVALTGAVAWGLLIPRVAPIEWGGAARA